MSLDAKYLNTVRERLNNAADGSKGIHFRGILNDYRDTREAVCRRIMSLSSNGKQQHRLALISFVNEPEQCSAASVS